MSIDEKNPAGFSLRRWSRRKLEAARAAPAEKSSAARAAPEPPAAPLSELAPASAAADAAAPAPTALPPVDTLTFDSDFTAFLQPEVDEAVKRTALRKLFRDPRFNAMDGLDVYIDDYSIPDPISPELVRQLMQARYIVDPPQTRINAQGFVEDVPLDERPAVAAGPEPEVRAPQGLADNESAAAPERHASPDTEAAVPHSAAQNVCGPTPELTGNKQAADDPAGELERQSADGALSPGAAPAADPARIDMASRPKR